MELACRICNNREANRVHTAREMAFGLREPFSYLECGQCGCVQIVHIPTDMKKYYPANYYSFQEHGRLKTYVRRQWSAFALGHRSLLGRGISAFFFPNQAMQAVRRAGVAPSASILDVGCGSGRLLLDLAHFGFNNLTGADPFIPRDLFYDCGVKVFKKNLSEMTGSFELIMLHHSFEHMEHPAEVMAQIGRLLNTSGQCILRIPVASSYAWRHYGVNWFHLDAPRHFFLHSSKSIELLAKGAGLKVSRVIHESTNEQFWASEQYARDIAANDPRSLGASPLKRLLAWRKLREYDKRAEEINRNQEGDVVCFHLQRNLST